MTYTPGPCIYNQKITNDLVPKFLNTLLLQCGDIHPHPGPMSNLLQKHLSIPPPTKDAKQHTSYHVRLEYQHLVNTFKPLFQITHPLHTQTINSLPYLYNYIQQHSNHPPPRIIYAMIVTINPSIIICNTYLQQQPTQD